MTNKETAIGRAVSDLRSKRRLSAITRDLTADGFEGEEIGEILREAMELAKTAKEEEQWIQQRHNLLIGVPIILFGVGFGFYASLQGGALVIPFGLIAFGVFECMGARNYVAELLFGISTEPRRSSGRHRRRRWRR